MNSQCQVCGMWYWGSHTCTPGLSYWPTSTTELDHKTRELMRQAEEIGKLKETILWLEESLKEITTQMKEAAIELGKKTA